VTRSFYRFILCIHPPAFRRRFCDEMLSILDEGTARHAGFELLLDAFISFARQWLLRTDSWKLLLAIGGAFFQVFGFAFSYKGRQSWIANHQAITPYMQELILIVLALMCSLFVMIMSLTLWTMRFQHRRSAGRRSHLAGLAPARFEARE
jgi:hypothetical protein